MVNKHAAAFLAFLISAQICPAQQNHITVNAAVIKNNIAPILYGSCMEDVNHEIYGGLYDQKIVGESFEEPASGVDYRIWKKAGGYWAHDTEYADNSVSIIPGRHTKRMIGATELAVEPDENAKLIYDAPPVGDGTIEGDMRFLHDKQNAAGFVIRASEIGIGENNFVGYEVRLDRNSHEMKLIRHKNDFRLLAEKGTVFGADVWNHIRVTVGGPRIQVFMNGDDKAVIDFTDTDPLPAGQFGLTTAGTPASFRNITVTDNRNKLSLPLVYGQEKQVSDRWDIIEEDSARAIFSLTQKGAFNGLAAQAVELTSGNGRAGVANRGLNRWGIAISKSQSLAGAVYLRTEKDNMILTVALESADGKTTYARQVLSLNNKEWQRYGFKLLSTATDSNARFSIYIEQPGKIYIDQATLMATGQMLYKGLPIRADIANELVAEGLTFMRYAGSMVNAHGYRFKKMIGDRAARPPYTGQWNEYSSNGFGIEEFLQFTGAAGITPLFAINIEETPDDMADMAEYLNGDETTVWGRQRAVNGHVAPYNVKYIEIGNEEVMFEGDDSATRAHYEGRFNMLYGAMHAKDTSLRFVASAWWRPESPNTLKTFRAIDGKASYWDYHVLADEKDAGVDLDRDLEQMDSLFHVWNPNTDMKCMILEENGGLHTMQRALGHATNLNAVRRHGKFVVTTVPANALQPYLQNDNGWDQGQIFFTVTKVWGMPPFYAQQMASRNHLPLRVEDITQGSLNVTATRSEDGKTLVLHIVNTDSAAKECAISINDFAKPKKLGKAFILSGPLNAENRVATPENLTTQSSSFAVGDPQKLSYTFEPYSYTILRFER